MVREGEGRHGSGSRVGTGLGGQFEINFSKSSHAIVTMTLSINNRQCSVHISCMFMQHNPMELTKPDLVPKSWTK